MSKKLASGFLFLTLFLLFTIVPSPAQLSWSLPTIWHIYPAMDRLQIQAMVNSASNRDIIYFHAGTYDWSQAPNYPDRENEAAIKIIDKTLTIKGEPGNLIIGPGSYKIDNITWGLNAFLILDVDTDNDVAFVGLNIQHFFRGICAFNLEYNVPNARNVTIKNCTLTSVDNLPITLCDVAGNILIQNNQISQCRGGMWVVYGGPDSTSWQPDRSCVNISGNTFASCRLWGIYTQKTKDLRIEKNSISLEDPSWWGGVGIFVSGAKKGTVISANCITNCQTGIYTQGYYSPPISFGVENLIIDNNKITCGSPERCYGIYFDHTLSSGFLVTRNSINLASTRGIGIFSEVNHSYYAFNRISGSGRFAVQLTGQVDSSETGLSTYAHHELFLGNDVSKFTPSEAHYYLDNGTYENLIIGSVYSPWTYKDFGFRNLIIGGTNITD